MIPQFLSFASSESEETIRYQLPFTLEAKARRCGETGAYNRFFNQDARGF
jgi:hypothetical protein